MNIRTDGKRITVELSASEAYLLVSAGESTLYGLHHRPSKSQEVELDVMFRAIKAAIPLVSL